ncbi:3'(2'),5'-bisphosphate nucleotidase CysQ [Solirhodobacter olei]|uniref:3'(2'),5'-bisphosphate nucleotidase CysQ n=1 Tax=Solirhodobacter olei TaxID=2493082 RepID=UPI000FD8455D|nr:3'(2'),5'-bisphosphate nucleotidase CysQ [Solirhodobacter olei]
MPESDLQLLTRAAREAGQIAMAHWRHSPEVWQKPDGAGPVTTADIEADRLIATVLRSARPDYGWLSEETEDTKARLDTKRIFIVDPIDGTRAFIQGEAGFAHSIAVAEAGEITAAVVFLPALELLYTASIDTPAELNGAPLTPSAVHRAEGASVLTSGGALAAENWPGGVPDLKRAFRPSLAWRLCLVAEGQHDGLVTFRDTWEWDIAAGALICARAGVTVTDGTGQPLRFNRDSPLGPGVLAAPPALHADLLSRRLGH